MSYPVHPSVKRAFFQVVLAAAVILRCQGTYAQGRSGISYEIVVRGRVLEETTGDPIKGAMVMVRRDGHSQDLIVTRSTGEYELVLERGSQYDITYTANGHVAKRVAVSTKGAPPQLDVPALTMTVDINLFPPIKNFSAALFEQPLGKAAYHAKARDIVWDEAYGKEMRNSIRLFMARYDTQLEKQEAVAGR